MLPSLLFCIMISYAFYFFLYIHNDIGKYDTWMNILLNMKRLKFDARLSYFFQIILVFININVFWKAICNITNQLSNKSRWDTDIFGYLKNLIHIYVIGHQLDVFLKIFFLFILSKELHWNISRNSWSILLAWGLILWGVEYPSFSWKGDKTA